MKKALALLLLLLVPCCAACGGRESVPPAYGTLFTAADPGKLAELYDQAYEASGYEAAMDSDFVYYDYLSSLLLALNAGQIAVAVLPYDVNHYIARRNDGLQVREFAEVPVSLQMGFRAGDADLREQFNAAIDAMTADGALAALLDHWVYQLPAGEEPAAGELPAIPGADTVRVGVTGDLPPLDYLSADGRPSGYNVAVLAEISSRIGKNIELVPIESAARLTALVSGKIDVIFWILGGEKVNSDGSVTLYSETDGRDEVAVTNPYYQGVSSWLSKAQ